MTFEPLVCVYVFEACRLSPPRCLRFESKKTTQVAVIPWTLPSVDKKTT